MYSYLLNDNENNITRKSVLGTKLESKGGLKFTRNHKFSSDTHSHPPIHTEERDPMCDDVCTFSAEMMGGVATEHELDTRVRHPVGLELRDVLVEGTTEAQRRRQRGNNLRRWAGGKRPGGYFHHGGA